jgi:predicted ArsR family transcriptional regulator
VSTPVQAKIRSSLRRGQFTAARLADAIGADPARVRAELRLMARAGEVESWKRPGTRARIWRLTGQDC